VGFELRPNLRAKDFLVSLFATVFGHETLQEDFDVASRKLDLALRELTRLLKLKSELRERVKLARTSIEQASGRATQTRADRKIFEEKHKRPPNRHVLFVVRVKSEAQQRYEEALTDMHDVEKSAFVKLREEQAAAKKLSEQLETVTEDYGKAEQEKYELSELVARTGLRRSLSALSSEDAEALGKTLDHAAARTRGDRRLLLMRAFATAILENPHRAFGLLRERKEYLGPETGAPCRLLRGLLDFLNGSDLTRRELGAFPSGNFTYGEEYDIYRFLQVANCIPAEGIDAAEPGSFDEMLGFLYAWQDGKPHTVVPKVEEWTANPLRTELALVARLARDEPAEALSLMELTPSQVDEMTQGSREPARTQVCFMRLAEQRALVPSVFKPNLERIFCLLLVALREGADSHTFELAREILRPEKCGNLHAWYRLRTTGEEPPLGYRRDPADLYWPFEPAARRGETK